MGSGIQSIPGSTVALRVPRTHERWGLRSPVYRGVRSPIYGELRPLHGDVYRVPGSHLRRCTSTAVKLYACTAKQGMLVSVSSCFSTHNARTAVRQNIQFHSTFKITIKKACTEEYLHCGHIIGQFPFFKVRKVGIVPNSEEPCFFGYLFFDQRYLAH